MTTMTTQEAANPEIPTKPGKSSTERIFGKDVTKHGYVALPNILVRGQARLGLSPTQFNILAQLLSYWIDPKRPPFPGKKELAARMGLNPATVRINIAKLEERGLVRREQRKTLSGDWNSNVYHLDGLVDALKGMVPNFEDEKKARAAKRAETEARSTQDDAAERSRRNGVVRRR